MINVLYLCDKKYYDTKMSRVRFHSIEAIEKVTNLRWSGPNWPDYNSGKTVQENVENICPEADVVIAYKPLEMKNFKDVKALKCVRYNEMYDKEWTFKEIMESQPNLVVCHHENDFEEYKKIFNNFNLWPLELCHIAHSAEKTVFKDYKMPKKHDLMIAGAVNIYTKFGQHYPLRDRMVPIVNKLSDKYKCYWHAHPGYDLKEASTNKYLIDFAKAINSSKIAITCSGMPRSRFGKYIEIPMCATALAADIPEEDEEGFRKFVIEINESMSDEEIVNKLSYYLENDEEREQLIQKGLEWSKNYTQEEYAKRFVNIIKKYKNGEIT